MNGPSIGRCVELHKTVCFCACLTRVQCLPDDVFVCKALSFALLVLYIMVLAHSLDCGLERKGPCLEIDNRRPTISCTRSWCPTCLCANATLSIVRLVFWSVPLLLWISPTYPILVSVGLVGALEWPFLTFPATPLSSGIPYCLVHFGILLGLSSPQQLMKGIQDKKE